MYVERTCVDRLTDLHLLNPRFEDGRGGPRSTPTVDGDHLAGDLGQFCGANIAINAAGQRIVHIILVAVVERSVHIVKQAVRHGGGITGSKLP